MNLSELRNLQEVSVVSPIPTNTGTTAKQPDIKPPEQADPVETKTETVGKKKKKKNLGEDLTNLYNSNKVQSIINGPVGGITQGAMGMASAYANQDGLINTGNPLVAGGMNILSKANPALGAAVQLGITGVNLVSKGLDGLVGKKNDTFYLDQQMADVVGGDYMGQMQDFLAAAQNSGKSKHWYQSADDYSELKRIQQKLSNKASDAWDINQIVTNMNDINSLAFQQKLDGGPGWLYAAKLGDKIQLIKNRRKVTSKKEGGVIPENTWTPTYYETPKEAWIPTYYDVEKFQEGGKAKSKNRTLEELIESAKQKNPRFVQRFSEPVRFIDYNGLKATHLLSWGDGGPMGAIVYPLVMEDDEGNLKLYDDKNDWEAQKRALEKEDYLDMTPEEAKLFTEASDSEHGYKKGWPEFFNQKFKNGGKTEGESEEEKSNQKSIIPEGALHAHKHHMEDDENITKKGIPVVDMDGEQQAEIERDEIIFNLTLTNKLEELYKEFYDENTKQKRKDELAIEAGKLLTEDIMHNLDDRTGLVDKCQKGGKLNEDK